MNSIFKRTWKPVVAIAATCLFGCASYTSAPEGGPKDLVAPEVVSFQPSNGSTNFKTKVAKIDFNEFIELKDQDKIYTSPLLKNVYYAYNLKQLKIDFHDTLVPNTTYTIRFGNSLVDLHEANPIPDFYYTFSTGMAVDSTFMDGSVFKAIDLKPVEKAHIMFYAAKVDSFPIVRKPDYVSVSDANGYFKAIHIKSGCYYIFAVEDENMDYMIDPITESMAYSDTCFESIKMPSIVIVKDTAVVPLVRDTLFAEHAQGEYQDSTANAEAKTKAEARVKIYMYRDYLPWAFLKNIVYSTKGKINLQFYYPIEKIDEVEIILPIDSLYDDIPYKKEIKIAANKLSADIFLQKSDIAEATMVLHVNGYTDTSELYLSTSARAVKDSLKFKLSSNARTPFFLFDTIRIESSLPIDKIDTKRIELWNIKDLEKVNDSAPSADTIRQAFVIEQKDSWSWIVKTEIKETEKYVLFLKDSAVFDFWGRPNDTTLFRWQCGDLEGRGEMGLSLYNLEKGSVYRLLLLEGGEKELQSIRVSDTGMVEFLYMNPGMYSFVLYKDDNDDGKWSEGDYVKRVQPEKKWFYSKTIRVEADWRVEEKWIVE